MAQLVKLQDYVSRYEKDLKRYPTQFIRLKKQQWERTKEEFEKGAFHNNWMDTEEEKIEEPEKKSFFSKLFHRNKEESSEIEEVNSISDEPTPLFFEPKIVYEPQTKEDLKRMYLDQLFHFQIKWASSTLREKSYVDPKFMRDTLLRTFMQTLPDNYFYSIILF
ncbi:hypothetical protein [Psychrobacillus sp. NEAU-3TGS]|uniref:hypothetical protein n=1 Tax=Psychrobacillus sp. NEAU-3TGS TaxID=2995412 RepID=UPI0032B5E69A